jgi:hypothetical protein
MMISEKLATWLQFRFLALLVFALSIPTLCLVSQQGRAADDTPEEGKLYVWPAPEKGLQTMLVLRAVDENRLEAALLVPLTIQLDYGKNPKASKEQLEQLTNGKLLHFSMRGKDRFGRLVADAWLGKETGWLSANASKVKLKEK